MMYEEELKVLRTVLEDQKKELIALKSERGQEEKKYENTVRNMNPVNENDKKEVSYLKIVIEDEKKKFKELEDKHKHLVDKLKDKIECPVCLEVPRASPVLACPNGHLVCKKCKTGSCPTCRVEMGNGRSLL